MKARLAIVMSAAALAAVVATPTFAASPRQAAQAAMAATGVVVIGNRIIGADPDPNVRSQLIRDADFSGY